MSKNIEKQVEQNSLKILKMKLNLPFVFALISFWFFNNIFKEISYSDLKIEIVATNSGEGLSLLVPVISWFAMQIKAILEKWYFKWY